MAPSSSASSRPGAGQRLLVGPVERPRRDLEQLAAHGRAELADQPHLVAVDRHDPDGPGMTYVRPGEVLPRGSHEFTLDEAEGPPCVQVPFPKLAERRSPPTSVQRDGLEGVEVEQSRRSAFRSGQGGGDEAAEQRVGPVGPALELRVGLGAHPERVAGQLDELDQPVVGRGPRAHQAGLLQPGPVAGVDLVAVAVALVDRLGRRRARPPASPASSLAE